MRWPTDKQEEARLVGLIGESWVWERLNHTTEDTIKDRVWLGGEVFTVEDLRDDKGWQDMDVDFAVTDRNCETTLIEVKTDQHALVTGNFALETKKVPGSGAATRGAWVRSVAHQWWYVCATQGKDVVLYILNAKVLRDIFTLEVLEGKHDGVDTYRAIENRRESRSISFICRLVPVDMVPVGWRGEGKFIMTAGQLDRRMDDIMRKEHPNDDLELQV